jgi:hypothetical protein
MPTCDCPHCGRAGIHIEVHEAHKVIECAKCGGTFVPMGNSASAPASDPSEVPAAPSFSSEPLPEPWCYHFLDSYAGPIAWFLIGIAAIGTLRATVTTVGLIFNSHGTGFFVEVLFAEWIAFASFTAVVLVALALVKMAVDVSRHVRNR